MGRSKKIGYKPSLLAKQVSHLIKIKTGVEVEPMFIRVQTRTFRKGNTNLDGLKWYMQSYNDILVGSKLPADVLRRCNTIQKLQLADNVILLEGIK